MLKKLMCWAGIHAPRKVGYFQSIDKSDSIPGVVVRAWDVPVYKCQLCDKLLIREVK